MNGPPEPGIIAFWKNVMHTAIMSTAKPSSQYLTIEEAYEIANQDLFDGQLPGVMITLADEGKSMGFFSYRKYMSPDKRWYDLININPGFFDLGEQESLQSLVHECSHQWQAHFGTPSRSGYHNKEWGRKMKSIGLMPSSTGKPGGREIGQKVADYAVEGPFLEYVCQIRSRFPSGVFTWRIKSPPRHQMVVRPTSTIPEERKYETESIILPGKYTNTSGNEYVVEARQEGEGIGSLITPSNQDLQESEVLNEIQTLPTKAPGRAGVRTKYQCGCRNNIWGKGGLKITCQECGHTFREL